MFDGEMRSDNSFSLSCFTNHQIMIIEASSLDMNKSKIISQSVAYATCRERLIVKDNRRGNSLLASSERCQFFYFFSRRPGSLDISFNCMHLC